MVGDAKAVKPYVEELMPVLKDVLFDPIPGVRGTAARAIGTLTKVRVLHNDVFSCICVELTMCFRAGIGSGRHSWLCRTSFVPCSRFKRLPSPPPHHHHAFVSC